VCIVTNAAAALDLPTWLLKQIASDERARRDTPDRTLADCAAKRRIVARYLHCKTHIPHSAAVPALLDVLKDLAVPYADRPGYRDGEWQPVFAGWVRL
jgi:hypothetical protein